MRRASRYWLYIVYFLMCGLPATSAVATEKTLDTSRAVVPKMLDAEDIARYKTIFTLQKKGKWDAADKKIAALENDLLLGYVYSQRYLHKKYRTPYTELEAWLRKYSDYPQAKSILKLAKKKAPKGVIPPTIADRPWLSGLADHNGLALRINTRYGHLLDFETRASAKKIWRRIMGRLRKGHVTRAKKLLESKKGRRYLNKKEHDLALWNIAASYRVYKKYEDSYKTARDAARRSGKAIPGVHWTAGLSAWQLGKVKQAATHFAKLPASPDLSPWRKAGGAFWASRAYGALKDEANQKRYLNIAAAYPRTFYGALARGALKKSIPLRRTLAPLRSYELKGLLRYPSIRRALALLQLDERRKAEKELRSFYPQFNQHGSDYALRLITMLDMPALIIRVARDIANNHNIYYDTALYPTPDYIRQGGWTSVDPALFLAFIRHESGFREKAVSISGARGLMQVMPATARYVSNIYGLGKLDAFNPLANLRLGAWYIRYLIDKEGVGNNLIYLMSAYNAGPGNLSKWKKKYPERDPLLFIENIPLRETRHYVKQVLANYWVYRALLNQKSLTLAEMAAGNWPHYRLHRSEVKKKNAGAKKSAE